MLAECCTMKELDLRMLDPSLWVRLPGPIRPLFFIPEACSYAYEIALPVRCFRTVAGVSRRFFNRLRCGTTDPEAQDLMERLPNAKCLADYERWTTRLDIIQAHEDWKERPETPEKEYMPDVLQAQINRMYKAIQSQELREISTALQCAQERRFGGMALSRLYKHCWFGTKHRIDDYVQTVRGTLDAYQEYLEEPERPRPEIEEGIKTLETCLTAHGQTALCLSGGALLGMKHIGVVKCLWESYLLPKIICGTSAGSIVASIVCCHSNDQMRGILERFPSSKLDCFDPPGTTLPAFIFNRARNFWKSWAMYDPKYLDGVMHDWIQDMTFREAYNKTGRILNIAVSRIKSADAGTKLLNYVNAPDVVIRTAVRASCAVPFAYPPATIYEKETGSGKLIPWRKHPGQKYVDGSLDSDIPIATLKVLWNVNFTIVSQVNPHVRFVLSPEEEFAGIPIDTPHHVASWWHFYKVLVLNTSVFSLDLLEPLSHIWLFQPLRFGSILRQPYTGDVNIYPAIQWHDTFRIMMNPDSSFMKTSTKVGEKATWPKMPRIQNCLAIEEALKRTIIKLNEHLRLGPRNSRSSERTTGEGNLRTSSQQPAFLRRRSLSLTRRPELRRNSSDEGSPPSGPAAVMLRRNNSEPDLPTAMLLSPPPSPGVVFSPQAGLRGSVLTMTPIQMPAAAGAGMTTVKVKNAGTEIGLEAA